MKEKINKKLVKLLKVAIKQNEVPVAAIITKNNKIISKGYNKKNKTNNPLMHAEIMCIIKATKKLKNWRLNDCELFVTLEPCEMCKKVIEQTRIEKVYFLCKTKRENVANTKYELLNNENDPECEKILKEFFKNKREIVQL